MFQYPALPTTPPMRPPGTPPRKSGSCTTPMLSHRSGRHRQGNPVSGKFPTFLADSPFISSHLKHETSVGKSQRHSLPTPLTLGTKRKLRSGSTLVRPSLRSQNLTAELLALSNSDTAIATRLVPHSDATDSSRACYPTGRFTSPESRCTTPPTDCGTPPVECPDTAVKCVQTPTNCATTPIDRSDRYRFETSIDHDEVLLSSPTTCIRSSATTDPTCASHESSPASTLVLGTPSTPPPLPRIEPKAVFEPFDSTANSVVAFSTDELRRLPKYRPPNPFMALSPRKLRRRSSNINYSTHLELLNHRTGERRVEELSDEQRAMKPRKLDFSGYSSVSGRPDYNITNKYLANSLRPKFAMNTSQE